ncbi:MAG: universal stress protein [Alphaproteobacteria bacterium]|nr:universal stress protein [Alphaproteobacteria bacterium]MDE2164564.1 universal stress protein [Alphaproteobacteria bacterium]
MGFKTLLVHLRLGAPNDGVLRIAGDLAERFGAHVIGVAVSQPMAPLYAAVQMAYGTGMVSEDITETDRKLTEKRIAETEERFRAALAGRCSDLEWRWTITPNSRSQYVARQVRTADLLITCPVWNGSSLDQSQKVSLGDMVMLAGRPVLLVPPETPQLDLGSVVVGWKDTREARRAVSDALPLLKLAGRVTVVSLTAAAEVATVTRRVGDVIAWLGRHGIAAEARVEASSGAEQVRLKAVAQECGAGLFVGGAYGHTRMREWVTGGVTMDLLMHPNCPTLISH